ncbi:MAG: DegV family protein [Eubacteriaceae bacterium]
MRSRIISDSSCDLPSDFLEKDGIDFSIVPLKIIVGDKEFIDDDSLDTMELIKEMKQCKASSFSACPSPEDFASTLRFNKDNYIIAMTSGLSGTYNSARVARNMVLDENPEINIGLFDSLATSSTMILMIMKLRDLILSGSYDFSTICEKLATYQKTLSLRFLIQDLSNLIKTGRMSRLTGAVASALSIFPICGANEKGQIDVLEKVRGLKKALAALANTVEEKLKTQKDFPVVITHCNNEEQATLLKEILESKFNLKNIYIFPMRGLASFYSNDKGLIMSF